MILDNFTLLILQRDRQHNLKYIAEYYKDFNCKKLIFDSSINEYKNIPYLNKCGFEYNYLGPMTYWEKLYYIHTSGKIDTEFVLDNPDDDITFKSAIVECVNFLSKNPSYNSCSGEHYWHNLGKISTHSKEKHLIALNHDKEFSDPNTRIHHYLNKYPLGMLHDVSRTSTISSFYKMIGENEFLQYVNYIDRMYIVYSAIIGNKKVLPMAFQARSNRDNERLIRSHKKAKNALREHVRLDKNLNFNTLQPLSKKLSDIANITIEEAFKVLKSEFEYHFKSGKQTIMNKNYKNLDPSIECIRDDYINARMENFNELKQLFNIL